jgi:hypothetical protein
VGAASSFPPLNRLLRRYWCQSAFWEDFAARVPRPALCRLVGGMTVVSWTRKCLRIHTDYRLGDFPLVGSVCS